MPIAITI
nr:4.8 kDa non-structural protein [Bovine coronavirus]